MYLKSIELKGFKSFAERVELHFQPGISAIVGPNGSGKSNIADAVRWVLGEQSARSLRGRSMEDVIFAGTEYRNPLGLAYVALTVDNADGRLPLDFDEVTISRRVYRSGESEYAINKTVCRLRDIQELFMDTGLGRLGGYGIIGQGQVTEIVEANAAQRRAWVEEVAGITRYRVKRRQALQKLASNEQDIARVQDVIAEIEGYLEPLRKRAQRARRYQELQTELRRIEIRLYCSRIARLKAQLENLADEIGKDKKRAAEMADALASGEQGAGKLQQQLDEVNAALKTIRAGLDERREALAQIESDLARKQERSQGLSKQLEEKGALIERLQEQLGATQKEYEDLWARCSRVESELEERSGLREALAQQIEQVRRKREFLETTAEEVKEELFACVSEIAAAKNADRSAQGESTSLHRRAEALRGQLSQRREELQQAEDELQRRMDECEQVCRQVAELQDRITDHRRAAAELREQLQQLAGEKAAKQKNWQELQARHRLLREVRHSYEGYYRGPRQVLRARERFGSGLLGSVAELIDVPSELETAIEAAAGSSLQYIVTNTAEVAERCVEYLKTHKAGRATFLPLEELMVRRLGKRQRDIALAEPACVGIAAELVSFPPEVEKAVLYVLGRVIVLRDLKAAVGLARRLGTSFQRLVTLEGETISPGGAITGGTLSGHNADLLARRRQIEAVGRQMAHLEQELANLKAREKRTLRALQERQDELEDATGRLAELKVDKARLDEGLVALKEKMVRLRTTCQELAQELDEVEEQVRQVGGRRQQAARSVGDLQLQEKSLRCRLQNIREELDDLRGQEGRLQEEMTAGQVAMAALKEKARRFIEERDRASARLKGLHQDLERARREKGSLAEQLQMTKDQWRQAREQRSGLVAELSGLKEQLETAEKQEEDLQEHLNCRQQENKALELQLRRLERRIRDQEYQQERAFTQASQAEEGLAGYGLHFQAALAESGYEPGDPRVVLLETEEEQLASKASVLRRQLTDLQPVDLSSIEEYEAAADRHSFLKKELADLQEARNDIEQGIKKLDVQTRKQFKEAYDRLRESFASTFRSMFDGGRADLVLSEPDNLLETGVEVVAQPHGKKPLTLELLSGGEKALTAIALLFAALHVRPCPFCILDEIDAALDEANLERFARSIREFGRQTQMILITHRQQTMELASVLHGITLDKSGTSRLVSLEMEEAG